MEHKQTAKAKKITETNKICSAKNFEVHLMIEKKKNKS